MVSAILQLSKLASKDNKSNGLVESIHQTEHKQTDAYSGMVRKARLSTE